MTLIVLFVTVLVLPVPTESDLIEMGAIVNGEAGGMPYEARWFIASQIMLDWYRLGTKGLDSRWYAYELDPTGEATKLVRDVFNAPVSQERCGLVGSKQDVTHWMALGYVPWGTVPDHHWDILDGRFEINAFLCSLYTVVVNRAPECNEMEKLCPR